MSGLNEGFMYFDENAMVLFVDPNKIQKSHISVVNVKFTLKDSRDAETVTSVPIVIR